MLGVSILAVRDMIAEYITELFGIGYHKITEVKEKKGWRSSTEEERYILLVAGRSSAGSMCMLLLWVHPIVISYEPSH